MYIFIHAQLIDKFTYSCCFIFLFLIIHIHIYFLYLQIGGAVNFVAVSEILKASPDVIAAAVAADNIVVALYFMLLFSLTVPDKVDARKIVAIKTVETTECPVAIPGESTALTPVVDSALTTTPIPTTTTSSTAITNTVDTNTNHSNNTNNNSIEEINSDSSTSMSSSSDSVTLPELSKALTISLILLGILWPYHYMLFYSVYMLYTIYSSYRRILHLCTLYTITL